MLVEDSVGSPVGEGAHVDGRYRLLTRLGQGTYGEVWRAEDTRHPIRIVALKILHPALAIEPGATSRFDMEAEILSAVRPSSIVRICAGSHWLGLPYSVREHVEGISLRAWMRQHQTSGTAPPLSTVRIVAIQLCHAIGAIHSVDHPGPIVHTDLAPDN